MTTTEASARLPKLSFMSANLLGREKGYQDVKGFGEGNLSIADKFSPAATYEEEIGRLFEEIVAMGFRAIDLWTAHLNPRWATPQHFKGIRAAAEKNGVVFSSIAGGTGSELGDFEALCRIAHEIGAPVIGLGAKVLPARIREVDALLEKYDLRFGFENHPNEKTPADVLTMIEHGKYPRIGSTLDTGWFATHGYPVEKAIEELREHLMLVHLKNIEAPEGHVAAAWNEGCLDLEPIVRKLREVGYSGYISLEYEPTDRDPGPSCVEFRQNVEKWLSEPVSTSSIN